jgi:REase_DpnII-MboI
MNLLPDAAEYLRRRVLESLRHVGVNSYFVAWLLPDMVDGEALRANALSVASRLAGAQRTYQDVATLGFAAECGLLDSDGIERLREGLRWMAGRTAHVDGYPADFCTDAVSLLGISLGLRRLDDSLARPDWIAKTCPISGQRADDWQASLIAIAHRVSGAAIERIVSDEVRLIAFSKGLVGSGPDVESCHRVLERLRATQLSSISDEEVPIRLAALKWVEASSPRISIRAATIADVVSVLRAVPSGLQRWTWEDKGKTPKSEPRKWHVDNEYHVQNLAWFLLGSIFPDAQYEEYKSAVATVHPRLDIVLPSLRLIVEVKFWRKGVKSEEMVRELAEDAALYLTPDAPYDSILPLIWDEGARTEEHAALISGLKKMKGICDVVVIPRPARLAG